MRLAIVQPNLTLKGGQERVVLEIARKFDPAIYCYHYNREETYPEFRDMDVRVLKSIPFTATFFPRVCREFYTLKIADYDVINAHWPPSEWIRNRNERVLWYCHSPARAMYDLYRYRMQSFSLPKKLAHGVSAALFRRIDRRIVRDIEHVFANSRNVQARLKHYLDKDSEVLSPGIDARQYENQGYERYFLVPGRIDPTKRIEYCLEAFRQFSKAYPRFRIIVAGSILPHHQWYLEELRKYGAAVLTDVPAQKMKSLYGRCYAVLFAAMDEDFGIIPLEAMAAEKPIIAVNEGGPKETIISGKTGFLVNSVSEMQEKMAYLAGHPDAVAAMGRAGRRHVQANYTWKRFLSRFGEKCREIAQE